MQQAQVAAAGKRQITEIRELQHKYKDTQQAGENFQNLTTYYNTTYTH